MDDIKIYNSIEIPKNTATVGTSATADYSSIQAAIDSGIARVLIEPGVYNETITLKDNITVAGSGAGLTTITMPGGNSATALVTIDGVTNATLRNVALIGNAVVTGVAALNGSDTVTLTRVLIQDMATAVSLDGSTTDVELLNTSLLGNGRGVHATNCASVDIRNTIFAYNTGVVLEYQGCAPIKRYQYNLYWANGTK